MGCGCNRVLSSDLNKIRILAQAMANETKVNQIIYEVTSGYNFCTVNDYKYQPKVEEISPEVEAKLPKPKQKIEVEVAKKEVEDIQ